MKHTSHWLLMPLLCAVTSDVFSQSAPVIIWNSSPRQVVRTGPSIGLAVDATGTPAVSHQWMRSGRPIPGATANVYSIREASPLTDHGWYQVVVSNAYGTAISEVMFVNVDVYSPHFAPCIIGGLREAIFGLHPSSSQPPRVVRRADVAGY